MMKKNNRRVVLAVVLILVVCAATIGGTIAWLTATTAPVTNTFTPSDINITLTETEPENKTAKMVPGDTIDKDPVVTVVDGSEDCWLFVKVDKAGDFDTYMTYGIADGWTALDAENHPGVYYREVAADAAVKSFSVLKDDQVVVRDNVTKTLMEALKAEGATYPSMTFTAYAIQKAHVATAAAAWTALNS